MTLDVYSTIAKNGGDHDENLADRVRAIDEVLINATYGTRSELLKELFPAIGASKLREVSDKDITLIQAKNILTRIDRGATKAQKQR